MAKNHCSIIDILVTCVSFITFALDVSTDILVCIQLLLDGQQLWGWLMVVFIIVPSILMSAFSLTWHMHDKAVSSVVIVSHLLLIAPIQRYVQVIFLCIKSYKTHKAVFTLKALRAQSDVSILRLFEGFLESAPQLVLQLYIVLYGGKAGWFTGLSAACSLVSLTWAMTAYSDSQRRAHNSHYQRHLIRLLLHWGWQLFCTASRIAAFVVFACVLHNWVFAVMGGHWLIAFVWISIRGTDFGQGLCEKWTFRCVCAFIYIFVFLNLNDGSSKWRITAYYILMLMENAAMLAIYLALGNEADSDMIVMACVVVFAGYFIGLLCMLLYYTFFHPSGSKTIFRPKARTFSTSVSSGGTGPQIFSIESPKPVTMMEGTAIDLSLVSSTLHNSATNTQQTWMLDQSTGNSTYIRKGPSQSQKVLQMAWQSGMESSSGSSSSSSLSTAEKSTRPNKRTPSLKSGDSASSENQLLPPGLQRNDLSRSPKASSSSRFSMSDMDIKRRDERENVSESDNINVASGSSRSPTLSRGSWPRLSHCNRQLLALEDFAVLGLDDSSSIDRRTSNCSSLSSQPKSLSPLNISSLGKDVHSRLRATIMATITAATGNQSSKEGTPVRGQSVNSYTSTLSSHGDSLNSSFLNKSSLQHVSLNSSQNNTVSFSHNAAFVDSDRSSTGASYRSKDKVDSSRHNMSLDSIPQLDDFSLLPDILEAIGYKNSKELSKVNTSFKKSEPEPKLKMYLANEFLESAKKLTKDKSYKSSAGISPKTKYSPYPEDSTLTASKLDTKTTISYLDSQRQSNPSDQDETPELHNIEANLSFSSSQGTSKNSSESRKHRNDFPFSDQELETVMNRSLQSYMGGSSANESNNPQREGLALTLEDLQISRQSTPEPLPAPHDLSHSWKSRSASSLFHDSTESSPLSSASKMNRIASIIKSEAKLSPNGLSQLELEVSPQTLDNFTLPDTKLDIINPSVAVVPGQHALNFIIEAYGPGSLHSPPACDTPVSEASFCKKESSSFPKQTVFCPHLPVQIRRKSPGPKKRSCRTSVDQQGFGEFFNRSGLSEKEMSSKRRSKAQAYGRNDESFHNSSERKSRLSTKDLQITERSKPVVTRGGVSSTKKLNVHFSDFPLLEYRHSPYHQKHIHGETDSDSESELSNYVAGQYCPPLCGNFETASEENSLERNLDRERRRNSYDLNSIKKSVLENSSDEIREQKLQRMFVQDNNFCSSKSLRRNIISGNLKLQKHHSDFMYPHQSSEHRHRSDDKLLSKKVYHSPLDEYSNSLRTLKISRQDESDKAHEMSNRKSTQNPRMSKTKRFNQSHSMAELSQDELHSSAEHVAEYFSEAIGNSSNYYLRPKKNQSQPLQVHSSRRQPLQQLGNSQQIYPAIPNTVEQGKRYHNAFSPTSFLHGSGLSGQKSDLPPKTQDVRQQLLFESTSSPSQSSKSHSQSQHK